MESQKLILEAYSELKVISDFVGRGNYSNILGVQPHSSALDGWAERCLAVSRQLEQVSHLIASEVKTARS